MSARWGWALLGGVVAGALAVGVVAAVDDGPRSADAQATTTTSVAPSGGADEGGTMRTVTVTADGTASGTPDMAIVQLGVRTRAESANAALDLANQKATQLLDALKFGGVEEKDITTTNVFVYPQYGSDGRKITGYEAGNTASVKIRDIANAGKIIDATAGVVGDEIVLEGVSFTIDDTGELRRVAREDALVNAEAQADQLAAASGLKRGPVVSIIEGATPGVVPVYERLAADTAGGSAAVPLEPGQQELNLAVTVVYELTD